MCAVEYTAVSFSLEENVPKGPAVQVPAATAHTATMNDARRGNLGFRVMGLMPPGGQTRRPVPRRPKHIPNPLVIKAPVVAAPDV